jgi:alpha-N-arabinofuranosidase
MQWASDLIGYDALTSYGSPSYWTQVMFAAHTGTEVVSATLANAGPRIAASVTRDEQRRKIFIKLVNGTSDAQHFQFALDGAPGVKHEATLVTMSGKSPNATNSINRPDNIKPVERTIQVAGPKFENSFVPYSVNVVELSY